MLSINVQNNAINITLLIRNFFIPCKIENLGDDVNMIFFSGNHKCHFVHYVQHRKPVGEAAYHYLKFGVIWYYPAIVIESNELIVACNSDP